MRLDSLYQTCFYITLILLVFSLCVTFISFLGVFGSFDSGSDVNIHNSSNTLVTVFGQDINMKDIFDALTSSTTLTGLAGLIGTIGVGYITRSASFIGVGLFSTLFWTSYVNTASILTFGNFVPAQLIVISSIIIGFLWVGAVIGMITGSG